MKKVYHAAKKQLKRLKHYFPSEVKLRNISRNEVIEIVDEEPEKNTTANNQWEQLEPIE